MASILTSSIVADIRGSVGTVVYSRGQGGAVVRARTTPHQHQSQARDECKAAMSLIGPAWSGTLTAQQRHAWHAYAALWPRPNKLGGGSHHGGFPWFTRANWYYARAWQSIAFLDAPPSGPIPPPNTISAGFANGNTAVGIPTPLSDYPVTMPYTLYVSLGTPVSPGRNFYSSPWRYAGTVETYPEEAPAIATFDLPWQMQTFTRLFGYVVAQITGSGEMSTWSRFRMDL